MALQVPPGSQAPSPPLAAQGGAWLAYPRGPSLRPRFGHDGTDWTQLLSASEVWQPGGSPPTLSSFLPKFQPFPVQGCSELPPLCQEGPQQGEAGEGAFPGVWTAWVGGQGPGSPAWAEEGALGRADMVG